MSLLTVGLRAAPEAALVLDRRRRGGSVARRLLLAEGSGRSSGGGGSMHCSGWSQSIAGRLAAVVFSLDPPKALLPAEEEDDGTGPIGLSDEACRQAQVRPACLELLQIKKRRFRSSRFRIPAGCHFLFLLALKCH